MPAKLKLELSEEQILELEELRDHASKPYLRERAAAILKIAQGSSGRETATTTKDTTKSGGVFCLLMMTDCIGWYTQDLLRMQIMKRAM